MWPFGELATCLSWISVCVGKWVAVQGKGLSAGERSALITPSVTGLKHQNSPCVVSVSMGSKCEARFSMMPNDLLRTTRLLINLGRGTGRRRDKGSDTCQSRFDLTGLDLSARLVVWVTAATLEKQKARNERKTEIQTRSFGSLTI